MARSIGKINAALSKGQIGVNNRRQSSLAAFETEETCFRHGARNPCKDCLTTRKDTPNG